MDAPGAGGFAMKGYVSAVRFVGMDYWTAMSDTVPAYSVTDYLEYFETDQSIKRGDRLKVVDGVAKKI